MVESNNPIEIAAFHPIDRIQTNEMEVFIPRMGAAARDNVFLFLACFKSIIFLP